MVSREFFESETTRKAYLGKHCFDLLTLSSQQAAEVYADRGLIIPLEVSSTLQYLSRHEKMSVADIAKGLNLPHQLATQRIEKLAKSGLIRKRPDSKDKRRSWLQLTKKGQSQAKLLDKCMAEIADIYEGLYREIGCDLSAMIPAATAALKSVSISDRLQKSNR